MPAPKSNNYSQNPMPQGGGPGQNPAPSVPTARPAGVSLGLPGVGGPAPRQAAPDPQWQPAAPGYLKVRFIHTVAAFVPVLLVGLGLDALAVLTDGPLWMRILGMLVALVAVFWGGWWLLTTPRRTRALAYALESNHLMTRRGLVFRSITSIPYGRIQYVDVDSGPLERLSGVSRLTVRTAGEAAGTVVVYGVPNDIVDAVRAELVRRADERMAAL